MRNSSGRLSFGVKPVIAIALAALADVFFWGGHVGSTLGVFTLALVVAVAMAHPAVRRDPRALGALAVAALCSLALFDAPGFPAWAFCAAALAVAVLSPRAGPGLDAVIWLRRLSHLAFAGTIGPALDAWRLRRRIGVPRGALGRALAIIAVPLAGGLIFLNLFTLANPIISQLLRGVRLPEFDAPRGVFWVVCLVGVWSLLRPPFSRRRPTSPARPEDQPVPGISVASVGLSLIVFNALFALQNGLDIAFLWSGAALPKGVTFAEYAHRGAYALILTALLAGAFVLVALRPGSATARRPWLRGLVALWVAQNVLLVASSILRTLNYIEAYSLTSLRIAALLWMGLVAIGLVLIGYRLLRGKRSAWLINANAVAAGLALAASSLVDFDTVSAEWNVTHAREVGGQGQPLDLCYLGRLTDSSIVTPLSELERRPLPAAFRDRVSWVRSVAILGLEARQARWRDWTWRGQRRLQRAEALQPVEPPFSAIWEGVRACDGIRVTPPDTVPPAPAPH